MARPWRRRIGTWRIGPDVSWWLTLVIQDVPRGRAVVFVSHALLASTNLVEAGRCCVVAKGDAHVFG